MAQPVGPPREAPPGRALAGGRSMAAAACAHAIDASTPERLALLEQPSSPARHPSRLVLAACGLDDLLGRLAGRARAAPRLLRALASLVLERARICIAYFGKVSTWKTFDVGQYI